MESLCMKVKCTLIRDVEIFVYRYSSGLSKLCILDYWIAARPLLCLLFKKMVNRITYSTYGVRK